LKCLKNNLRYVTKEFKQESVSCVVSTVSASSSSSAHQQYIKWQKPGRGRLKCNVDAAFSSSLNVIGFGMCIRDETGQFVAAKTLRSSPICDSSIGEALGLSYAIQWVHEMQLTNVDFEMDVKRVVDYYIKGSNDISEFGAIIDDCRRRCCIWFENSKVEFNRRQANMVTHILAREAILLPSPQTFNVVPSCIGSLISNEKV